MREIYMNATVRIGRRDAGRISECTGMVDRYPDTDLDVRMASKGGRDSPSIRSYMRSTSRWREDNGVDVEVCRIRQFLLERELGVPSDPFVFRVEFDPV
jgi:hypothetical protein